MPARAAILAGAVALLVAGCAQPAGPSPTPAAAPTVGSATPVPAESAPAEVPALAGSVLSGVEPTDAAAPSPEAVSAPGDIAFQDVVAVAGLVDACDLQTQSLDYAAPGPAELDALIAERGDDPVLSSLLWAGSLESLAAALGAERVLLDEGEAAGWLVYDVDGLPRTASVTRLESAGGMEVWLVGLEVTAALPCD